MTDTDQTPSGPDLSDGIGLSQIADGATLAGHVNGTAVLLARRGSEIFAIGATCTHYGGPLAEGLLVDDTVRCPWHHACFSLRTGAVLRAPALDPVACWRTEQRDGKVYVRDLIEPTVPQAIADKSHLESVVIIGGGAAGNAAAETLRQEGYAGQITVLSADADRPCDRPNLSKGFLAGTAPAEWIPLRAPEFYEEQRIDLRLDTTVTTIDVAGRQIHLADGSSLPYGALLLATGAEPVRLDIPGATLDHVYYLRTHADARALVAKAGTAKRAVVIGASFIGLEVAAALRSRGLDVHIVAPDEIPMARILGTDVGTFVRGLHERHGVTFHLGTTVAAIEPQTVRLKNGEELQADFVVVGIGVRPALKLAELAGLAVDRGVTVDAYLQTSADHVFAAGDIARWPDPLSGDRVRIEHWVLAERQGQIAARNILGRRERFETVPFFWTEQYDFTLSYVGHAERWDQAELDGQLDADTQDCAVTYSREGVKLAVATIHRDIQGLQAEVSFEATIAARG